MFIYLNNNKHLLYKSKCFSFIIDRKGECTMSKKLVMIDGNSLLFRAYYALPLLHNDSGVYTNAIYGFTNIILNILEEEKPTHMLVAFDADKTTFRNSTYKDYKNGRQKTTPELYNKYILARKDRKKFE